MKFNDFIRDRGKIFNLEPHLPGENGEHWLKIDLDKKELHIYPISCKMLLVKIQYCWLTKNYYFYFRDRSKLMRMIQIPAIDKKNQWVYEYHFYNNMLGLNEYYLHKTYDLVYNKNVR